ncbi:MAG: tripartite tricarboxylate transporter substrate binding protein [Burkholderiaceae bacterium]|nr:tripartite tricarboxylate transporter substrate binding protein [Burkholderiaceae bacterium]
MDRRALLEGFGGAFGLLALASVPRIVLAQADRPIVLVVPYAPGGTSDLLGRLIAQHLGAAAGRTVVVENRPGAGTGVGASHVARAAADGTTLLLATSTTLAINPSLYPKLAYDPATEFAPVGLVAAVPFMLVVHPSLRVNTVAELVSLAKRDPEALNYGSAGNGSPQHLIAEMFKAAAGIRMQHVPYKGSAPAITDLVGGQINVMFSDFAPAMPHVKSGALKALAVTTATRVSSVPDLPTIAESRVAGTADFEAVAWQGVVAPAATPKDVIVQLHRQLNDAMTQPEAQAKLRALNVEPRTSESPAQFAAYIRSEAARWGEVVRASGATVD